MKKIQKGNKKFVKKSIDRTLDYFWVATIITFFCSAFIIIKFASQNENILDNSTFAGIFGLYILIGIASFIVILVKIKFKETKPNFFNKHIFLICLMYLLVNSSIFASAGYIKSNPKNNSNTKVETLSPPITELQNVKFNGNLITGTIFNKSNKTIFNTKIILKISKDRTKWDIDELHEFVVPYEIEPNQSINFSEKYKTTKKNPWWTAENLDSQFYNGENIPTPTPTNKPIPKTIDSDPIIDCKSSYPNCNGSSIRVHQSQCSNITCCQIGSSWSVFPSNEECNKAQNEHNSGSDYIYTYPTSKPISNTDNPTPTPTKYQVQPTATPTINVGQVVKDIESCQSQCSAEGSSNETKIHNNYRAQGALGSSFYYQAIADNNAWVQNCINSCY